MKLFARTQWAGRARSEALVFTMALGTIAVGGCTDSDGPGGGAAATSTTSGAGTGGSGGTAAGSVRIPGLSASVDVTQDENGILHLTCATDDDCYATLGYFHASNRFFFMDFVRSAVRGRLGGLVKAGALVLDRDFANRRFFSTRDGEPLAEKLYDDASPAVRGYLDAYARGVNAWIGDMRNGRSGATLTTEYDFALIAKEAIRDWEPADSTAVGLYVLHDLSNKAPAEIARAEILPYLDPTIAPDLFSARPVFEAFALPSADPAAMLSAGPPSAFFAQPDAAQGALLRRAGAGLAAVGSGAESRRPGESGSNNWVLSPSRTAGGRALVADDPHLALTNPSIWFPVELDARSRGTGAYHVAGSTFPGLPSVMLGHNESLAWGLTTANWDLSDVYLEKLSTDGNAVVFQGKEVPIVSKDFTFDDASTGISVTRTARWVPHHGPILAEDPVAGTALSVRWTGHDGGTDLDGFFAIGRASSTAEAKEALAFMSSASQSFVVADMEGHIGWYPYSRVPARPWASAALPPWLPVPGDGTAEWSGYVPLEDLPQSTDPPTGAIATANQDLTGASADGDPLNDGQAALQAITRAEGTRARRILDVLEAGGNAHSVATMNALQGDSYSLYGTVVVPAVLAAFDGAVANVEEQRILDALTAWQFTCPTGLDGDDPVSSPGAADEDATSEAIGCSAFHATLLAITATALGDEIAAADALSPSDLVVGDRSDIHLVVRALKAPSSIASGESMWDDVTTTSALETRDEILRRGVSLAASKLAATGAPDAWRWGRLHTLSLRSIYDSFGVKTYNSPTRAAPGGLYTVNVANPRRDLPADGMPWDFAFTDGASVRFVVELGPDHPRMTYQLPGGVDLHRESPFHDNLLERWLHNDAIPFPFGEGAVVAPAARFEVHP